ncbi:hypothetical protein KM043_009682 [Ampulex compressa]|nr:hypothetical protein KM043_009682 [Ampulex compressa]
MRGTYPLLDEDLRNTGATIELFVRLSYLGVCVTTEIESLKSNRKSFQAREDTDQGCPYQFREVSPEEIGVRPTDQLGDELRKVAGISLATVEDGTGMDKSELQARTASKRGKRGRKKNGEGEEESDEMRLKRLQALLKKSRRGAACSVGIVDKPRKSCPPSSYPHICEVPPAAPICGYLQPCGVFSILCQQPFDYCHSVAQPIPCFNPV